MNALKPMPGEGEGREAVIPIGRDAAQPDTSRTLPRPRSGRVFIASALLLAGGLAYGAWQHSRAEAEVKATSVQRLSLVPNVRVVPVRANDGMVASKLPGSTEAFEAASISARISGYVAKRYVDMGDRVKAGQILAEISAPELDHQIAQAQATLAQSQAALARAQATREIANVTWDRDSKLLDKGWVTEQQGDTERLNVQAQDAAVAVAEATIRAQQALIHVLLQQKAYQRVVAPFDGVVTQRNIDNGSLVQADTAGGKPWVGALVRVPECCRRERRRPHPQAHRGSRSRHVDRGQRWRKERRSDHSQPARRYQRRANRQFP
jgi:multidrug efflux pump subunit AcrA (membrane-fusion protein)